MKNNTYTIKVLLIQIFCIVLASLQPADAASYYSRQTGAWSDPASWSIVNHSDPNPGTTVPGASDQVFIGKGHAITIDANAFAFSILVGDSGLATLSFGSTANHTLTVSTYLNVAASCSVVYNQNATRSHSLIVGGGMSNNGSVNLYQDANDFVNITFNGSASLANINGAGTWSLNQVTLSKSDKNKTLNVSSNAFELAIKSIVLQTGTYRHMNSGTFSINKLSTPTQVIGSNVKLHVGGGTVEFSQANSSMVLQGAIILTSGTLKVCNSNGSDGIRYEQVGSQVPSITVGGSSVLIVNGGIRPSATQPGAPLSYVQTGGTVRLNLGRSSTTETTFSMGYNSDSQFMLTNGSMVFEKSTAGGPSASDIDLSGNTAFVDISGGTMQFGGSSTSTGSTFRFTPYANVQFPHVWLTGPGGAAVTLRPGMNNTEDIQMMSLRVDANKTFDIRSSSGSTGDSRTMTLSGTYDNVHTLYNNGTMNMRSSTLSIDGNQTMGMNALNLTTLNTLRINTPAGVNMYRTFQVAGRLDLVDGKLNTTAASPVVCLPGSSWSPGAANSFVDGPFHAYLSTSGQSTMLFPVGDQAAFRPMSLTVSHNSSTPVEYRAEVVNSSARNFGFALPASLTHVSDVRYFRLEREAIANLTSAVLTLVYGSDDVVTEPLGLRVARDNGSGSWIDLGGDASTAPSGAVNTDPFYAFNSYFTLANGTGFNNPLPVELVRFEGKARNASVELSWTTASELNSDYFDVERSTDGFNFSSIGRVQAAGFSTSIRKYVLDDRQPVRGVNYYRLRQVDRDGTVDFSHVVSARFVPTRLEVFPNPASGTQLTIRLPEGMGNVQAELTDMEGRSITAPTTLQEGFSAPAVDISGVTTGAYMLRITDEAGAAWTERIVISH